MARSNRLLEAVLDRLAPLGEVRGRAMFGGFGLYLDGLIFGLIAWDRLYFKVDDANRAAYAAAGSGPFTYETAGGKRATMSYWEVPAAVQVAPDELRAWALDAQAASRRAQAAKRPGRKATRVRRG